MVEVGKNMSEAPRSYTSTAASLPLWSDHVLVFGSGSPLHFDIPIWFQLRLPMYIEELLLQQP